MKNVKKHAYWIHERREDKSSISGYIYLPQCKCSNCGNSVNMEKPVCPYCGALMDKSEPEEKDAQ